MYFFNVKILLVLLYLICAVGSTSLQAGEQQPSNNEISTLHIAVASNFKPTLTKLVKLYQQSHPEKIITSSASTGKLATQIRYGAPYDIFLAADKAHPLLLLNERLALADSMEIYATGQLVLISRLEDAATPSELLRSGTVKQLAIANPDTAPYGTAARHWLNQKGLHDQGFKFITGENINQAWQFFQKGGADAAFVAYSQVLLSNEGNYRYWILTEKASQQLKQAAVILTGTKNLGSARRFMQFLLSAEAQNIMAEAGYHP